MGPFQILLFVVWAVSAVALTILVLMHSGKGTGVSDMIASSLYNSALPQVLWSRTSTA